MQRSQCNGERSSSWVKLTTLRDLGKETVQFFLIILEAKSCTKTTIEPEINITITLRYLGSHWGGEVRSVTDLQAIFDDHHQEQLVINNRIIITKIISTQPGQWAMSPLSLGKVFLFDVCELCTWEHFFLVFWGSIWDLGRVSFFLGILISYLAYIVWYLECELFICELVFGVLYKGGIQKIKMEI